MSKEPLLPDTGPDAERTEPYENIPFDCAEVILVEASNSFREREADVLFTIAGIGGLMHWHMFSI
jgi:hypothetical protein